MRYAAALVCSGLVVAGLGPACGGDDDGSGGTSGDGGMGATGGTGAEGGTGGIGGGEGGEGGAPDGNDSFETATVVAIGDDVAAAIDPLVGDVDYYRFTASAGQWIAFGMDAVPDPELRDPARIDGVVTLYDENETQIAFNDDPFPDNGQDSLEHTRLVADGTYFLKVEEFCNTPTGQTQCEAGWESTKTSLGYQLILHELDDAVDGLVEESEPNDTPAQAKALEFPTGPDGSYDVLSYDYGMLEPGGVDVFSFVVPTEADFFGYAPGIWIPHYFSGPDKNGSTSPVGPMWIVHEGSQQVVARVELPETGQSLSPRVTPGETYHLFVSAPDGALGANPFYVLLDVPVALGQLEQDEAGNGTTAETVTPLTTDVFDMPGATAWAFTGDIVDPSDRDRFLLTMPDPLPTDPTVAIQCLAERRGSGLRGFAVSVEKGSDNSEWLSETESATNTVSFGAQPLPAGETSLVVDLSAASIDAMNPSTFYQCTAMVLSAP